MANAITLNATLTPISVNLNVESQNQILGPMQLLQPTAQAPTPASAAPRIAAADSESLQLAGFPYPINAFPSEGRFGGGGASNVFVIFPQGSSQFQAYTVTSEVSTTLDLYLYVMGNTIAGTDQTGSSRGISVEPASEQLITSLVAKIPAPVF